MEAFISSSSLSWHRPLCKFPIISIRPSPKTVAAARGDNHGCEFGRKFVDADMAVLRNRIREIEAAEGRDEDDCVAPAPEGWMGWEKQYYYERYESHAAMELQGLLLRTRPALALGLAALLVIGVSATGILAVF